jgi:hypothetical protein
MARKHRLEEIIGKLRGGADEISERGVVPS